MPAIVLVFLEQQATELLWVLYRRQHIPPLTFKTLTLSIQLWSFKSRYFEKKLILLFLCQLSCAFVLVLTILCKYSCAKSLVSTFCCQCSRANLVIVLMFFLCRCYSCAAVVLVPMLFLPRHCYCAAGRYTSPSKEAGLVIYLALLAKVANLYYMILTAFKKYWPDTVAKFTSGTQDRFI